MSDLARRPNRLPRRVRRQRAYGLVLATGGLSAIAVVGFLLAVFGVIGFGGPVLAGIGAVACGFLLRRLLGP